MKGKRALILDGETRAALAVTRSLGRAGFEVFVASNIFPSLAGSSRFATRAFLSPSPQTRGTDFQTFLRFLLQEVRPHYLLPVTNASLLRTLPLRRELPADTVFPFPSDETLRSVVDKSALLQLAKRIGVSIPETVVIPPKKIRQEKDERIVQEFCYPACLKPCDSDSLVGITLRKFSARYPENAKEVQKILSDKKQPWLEETPFLLQQRIEGRGVGVFAICRDGIATHLFAHRRILEKPPSGGVSVLSESIPLAEAPVAAAEQLLKELRWNGAAMVEFKQSSTGEFFLMEINPRFWGSLQLAIDSGRDYPTLLYRLFHGENLPREQPYQVGKRLRSPMGTFDHLFIRMRKAPLSTTRQLFTSNTLQLFHSPTRWDVFRIKDPGPAVRGSLSRLCSVFKRPGNSGMQ